MLERALILAALAGLILLGWALLRVRQARRLRALGQAPVLAEVAPPGRPAVVAFSLPSCGECRFRQAPALRRLDASLAGAATVRTVGADEHPALVERLGILTVPATVVLDAAGRVRFLNQGFADEARLAEQLAAAGVGPVRLPATTRAA